MNDKTVSPQNSSRLRDQGGCSGGRGGEGENAMYNIFKKFFIKQNNHRGGILFD